MTEDTLTLAAILIAIAVALALMALYNNHRTREAELEHPPGGRFITVGGVRLHYLERGQGSPVLLLHGNVVTAQDYELSGVLERAAAHHRVIAFDRPGYGYSDRPKGVLWTAARQAELLDQALRQLGIVRPVVVGHSWGTLVALQMALNHADNVAGLVLLGGYYRPTARPDVLLAAPPAIPVIGGILRHTLSPLLGSAMLPLNFKAMFAPLEVPEHFKSSFPYGFPVRPGQIRAEAQDAVVMIPAALKIHRRYGELRLPIVIMAGTQDLIVNHEKHARWFHEQLPGSHLRLVPGAGHMVHYAVPEQVVEAIEGLATAAPTGPVTEPASSDRPGTRRPWAAQDTASGPTEPGADRT